MTGHEQTYLDHVFASRRLAGPGEQSLRCQKLIEEWSGAPAAFLVPSCSAALEMSAFLLDLAPGDEVIMPSFTFVSTANAVVLRGAVPVFVDVDPITFNLNPLLIETAITPKTKAIFVVHYAGVPAEMDAILDIAARNHLSVVEDSAQAYGSTYKEKPAGTFGIMGCISFDHAKNVSAGEAGALLINDENLVERAAIIREKGTDRSRFLQGKVDAYTWQDVGFSNVVNELTAGYLRAQLEDAVAINNERLFLWQRYQDAFNARKGNVLQLPALPENITHNAHIYFVVLPDLQTRISLQQHLAAANISSATHYMPLHAAAAGERFGRVAGSMENTVRAGDCLLRLPLFNGLGDDQERVIDAVQTWAESNGANN
jgi:dTDP-4-amino-4,6-dideoxygalactose transaminase